MVPQLNVAHLETSLTTEPTLIDAAGTVRIQRTVEEVCFPFSEFFFVAADIALDPFSALKGPNPTSGPDSNWHFSSRRGRYSSPKRGLLMITLASRSSSLSSPSPSSSSTAALPPVIAEAINAQVLSVAKDMHWSTRQHLVKLKQQPHVPRQRHHHPSAPSSQTPIQLTAASIVLVHAQKQDRPRTSTIQAFQCRARGTSLRPRKTVVVIQSVDQLGWLRHRSMPSMASFSGYPPTFHSQTWRLTTWGSAESICVVFVVRPVECEDLHSNAVVFGAFKSVFGQEIGTQPPTWPRRRRRRPPATPPPLAPAASQRKRGVRGFVSSAEPVRAAAVVPLFEHDVLRTWPVLVKTGLGKPVRALVAVQLRGSVRRLHIQLREAIRGYRIISAPIRRVPDEILGEIFAACVALDKEGPDACASLQRIVRVCRRWRNVALSISRLWNYISVDARRLLDADDMRSLAWESEENMEYALMDARSTIRRAQLHLKNSGHSVPLSVFWSQNIDPAEVSEDIDILFARQYSAFLKTLLLQSTRVVSLKLHFGSDELRTFIARASRVSFPALEEVDIRCSGLQPADLWEFLRDAISLRHLRIQSNRQPIFPDQPWGRLRSCKFEDCDGDEILRIISCFSAGASVYLHNIGAPSPLPPSRSVVQTQVATLHLISCAQEFSRALLGYTRAPALTELCIRGYLSRSISSSGWPPLILPFLAHSSCQLSTLRLGVDHSSSEALFPHLVMLLHSKHTHSLVELDLTPAPLTLRVLALLTAQPNLLPHLRTLRVRYWHCGSHKLDEHVLERLNARRPELRWLWLRTQHGISGISGGLKRRLRARGLAVETFWVPDLWMSYLER
ncbi:F-box domain-containing protein [Mycena chlorophos]|uniref:F-box domain-containing protein n=1 Tax=Mycena chlorophos TaxID=658473 RepID=A0A8H6RZ71_MYCCL|nr:F-box domain-containing protein [Mycena chlorophos]